MCRMINVLIYFLEESAAWSLDTMYFLPHSFACARALQNCARNALALKHPQVAQHRRANVALSAATVPHTSISRDNDVSHWRRRAGCRLSAPKLPSKHHR